jgi:4-aminobutyrate--pyruvate transaminase
VADEVITGFGRTGNWFGSQTYDIQPDMLIVAKALTSGYLPMSALMVKGDLYRIVSQEAGKIGTFGHGFTYGGHPVAAAVALETLSIYKERDLIGQVQTTSPHFQKAIRSLADHPLVGEARGIGMIGAIELVADKDAKIAFDPALQMGAKAAKAAQENGVILRCMGDVMAFSPPLVITTAEVDEMFGRVRRALDQLLP